MKRPRSENTSFTVRDASRKDAEAIQGVFHKTWLATYPNEEAGITIGDVEDRFKDAYSEEVLAKRREAYENPPEGHRILVAEKDGEVVGICRLVLHHDKNQLQAIYVLPEFQGKGVGRAFWDKAQTIFDHKKDIIVEVAIYNQKAIDFYTSLGFVDSGKRFIEERLRMKSGAPIPEMEMIIKAQ